MWNKKLCLGVSGQFGIPLEEQIKVFKQVGFEAVFFNWNSNLPLNELTKTAEENGVEVQSVHAPFTHMRDVWEGDDEKASAAIAELMECLKDCAENKVPIMVVHAFIGFKDHTPKPIGIERIRPLIEMAEKVGVKLAFENTEGIEYLDAIMTAFKDSPAVGFCLDTGHEMCYNYSMDMLARYGDRLIATHINDNLGIKSNKGEITYIDDLHLLPFDGVADWDNIVDRLYKANYRDILTFELNITSKPNRHENDKYKKLSLDDYLAEAYCRACRVATKLIAKERAEG